MKSEIPCHVKFTLSFNALYPCTSRPVMLEPGPALGMGSSIVGSLSKMFDLLTFAPFLNF